MPLSLEFRFSFSILNFYFPSTFYFAVHSGTVYFFFFLLLFNASADIDVN
jgi:hypothetical protein